MTRVTPIPVDRFLRSLHICPRYSVAYVNNAKAACSSIKLALQRAQMGDSTYKPPWGIHNRRNSPLVTSRDLNEEDWADELEGRFVFSFVRSPWGRLRSAYLNKIVSGQKRGLFREELGFDPDTVPSFEAFVHALGRQEPSEMDAHWRPQWINLSHDVIDFDFIGRLEQLAFDWARVAEATGLDPVLPRAGRSTSAAGQALVFDQSMSATVRRVYAEDFGRFGYPLTPP